MEDDFYLNVSVWVARMLVMRTGQALTTSLHFSGPLLLSSEHNGGYNEPTSIPRPTSTGGLCG